jgi:hypothetical protein
MLLFTSCNKEKLVLPEANDPVFKTTGEIGGESFEIIAGDDGAYMHTMTLSENGVQVFSGKMESSECSVELGIYDGNVDMPGHVAIDNLQNFTPTFSRKTDVPILTLEKSMLNNQNIESVEWYVNYAFAGVDQAPIYEPGKYNVCAIIHFMNGETGSLCDEIIVGYNLSSNCSVQYYCQQGVLETNINITGDPIDEVKWFVNDTLIPGTSGLTLQQNVSAGLHTVKAEVHFSNGVVRTRTILVDGGVNYNSVGDFSVFEMSATGSIPAQDYNLRLKLQHDGKTYLSEWADNTNSTIQVTGLEYYGQNANGKDVYKVSATIDATVMETVTENMIPVSFSTVFGIEIP